MRRVALLVLVAACGSDDPPTGTIEAHVTHYDYAFDIDTRVAHAEVTLALDTAGNCITLPMRAALNSPATLGGDEASATPTGDDTGLIEFCGTGWDAGESIVLATDVTFPLAVLGPSQVGYSIKTDSSGNKFYYLVSWVNGCDQFGPCDNRPDQFATYTFTVTHPDTYKARCPGTITELSTTQTKCDFDLSGGPTYSTFGVAAYPAWQQIDKGTWGSVKVTLYDRPTTMEDAAIDPAYHGGFMSWMESTFGPYPFGDELRVLTAPTYWGGFEHPGNIVLADSLAKGASSYWSETAHTLDHEIAHMWAGNQTTLASTYDFVWKEAMAEYLPYVWEDMQSSIYGQKTAAAWKSFSVGAAYYPVPLGSPELFDYYGDVYGPGPMILFRQLEVLASRAQVIAAIQSALAGGAHALSVDALLAALETSTGLDLDAYAAGWIRGNGAPAWPKYNVTYTPGSLQLVQANKGPNPLGCKFHVALRGSTAGEEQLVEVNTFANGVDQTIAVTPAFTVADVVLDPLAECLVYPMSISPLTQPLTIAPARHPWLR